MLIETSCKSASPVISVYSQGMLRSIALKTLRGDRNELLDAWAVATQLSGIQARDQIL